MTDTLSGGLDGRTILIVEDDYFLAQDITRAFARSGAAILGPASNVVDALDLLDSSKALDGAVLDINLMGEKVFPVADALKSRNVPFVFATGYDAQQVPAEYGQIVCFQKPLVLDEVVDELLRHLEPKRRP